MFFHVRLSSTGQHGAGVQAVQSCSCHLHVFPSRRCQQFRGGQRGRLRLHVVSSWKVCSQANRGFPPACLTNTARKLRRLVRPTSDRVSNKYSPLTSQCNANPTLDLLLFEVSLLPSYPVFLFRLSVVFVKVAQHKQGTHAGGNKSFFSLSFFFLFRSPLYVSLGERVCLYSVFPGEN